MTRSVNLRGVLLTGVIAGLLWFGFYGQDLWLGALGIADIPGAELYVLGLLIVGALGFVWPEPLASLGAGVGGLAGMLVAVTVTDRFEDYLPPGVGFDSTWFQLLVIPAGAHVLGAALGQVVRRPGPTAAELPAVIP